MTGRVPQATEAPRKIHHLTTRGQSKAIQLPDTSKGARMEAVFLEFCPHLLTVLVVKEFRNVLYFALSITFSWLCWALIVKIGCKTKVHGSQQETPVLPRIWVKVKTFPFYELLIP